MCMECLEACPRSSIVFKPGFSLEKWQPYDPERRQLLATFGVTLASLAFLRVDALLRREHDHLLRPPGACEKQFHIKMCALC